MNLHQIRQIRRLRRRHLQYQIRHLHHIHFVNFDFYVDFSFDFFLFLVDRHFVPDLIVVVFVVRFHDHFLLGIIL